MSYVEKLTLSKRPEEIEGELYGDIWPAVNAHLNTQAHNHAELVEQLGVMRFGHRPKVADTFCGGGSIPFEAARLGCDVYASDLNPIACMLTWGALNIIGADETTREEITAAQRQVAEAVDDEITALGIEHDAQGNRAKAYLYCLETHCPETGWRVPMAPSWVISKTRNICAKLVPNPQAKCFDIEIVRDASTDEMKASGKGTVQAGYLEYTLDGELHRTAIKTLRGDYKKSSGGTGNRLRLWEKSDFTPRPDDIFLERLYCIQWTCSEYDAIKDKTISRTEFRSVTVADLKREAQVEAIVEAQLADWQTQGWVPDMAIEPGYNTDQPIHERGWTHWHHLFNARQLLLHALYFKHRTPEDYIFNAKSLDWNSRIGNWMNQWEKTNNVFYNQALNTFYNYGTRCFTSHEAGRSFGFANSQISNVEKTINNQEACKIDDEYDIFVTDPPYADAVHYHEITEFFIAWLRKNPPEPFKDWTWDSRRALAIKGDGEEFRRNMVDTYTAMADHMPDNGLQIIMFTHQDSGVWADMTNIVWAAGLQVTAAWYIATETTSELKKGGYVQGTVLLVLRKRDGNESAYQDELVQEIREEVQSQIETLIGLNQSQKHNNRDENLFSDADLQMAGYAAALRVLTAYAKIDGMDMTQEALRPKQKGQKTLVDDIIALSVQIANEFLVPEGLDAKIWEKLTNAERFYLKMLELEAEGLTKLDNYQNFAKAFKLSEYDNLMHSVKPNNARLKSAIEFARSEFSGSEFGESPARALLYALMSLQQGKDSEEVMANLRDNVVDYLKQREVLAAVSQYLGKQLAQRSEEASAARVLNGLIRNEKVAGR